LPAVAIMTTLKLSVQGQAGGDVLILHCEGRIAFGAEGTAFRERLVHLLAGTPNVVVDLKRVDHIDSTGLGMLAGLLISAKRRGGEIKLVCPARQAKDALRRTHLDTVFNIYEKDAEAVAAFPKQDADAGDAC
jgi:anti-sigma B factor antagonist